MRPDEFTFYLESQNKSSPNGQGYWDIDGYLNLILKPMPKIQVSYKSAGNSALGSLWDSNFGYKLHIKFQNR